MKAAFDVGRRSVGRSRIVVGYTQSMRRACLEWQRFGVLKAEEDFEGTFDQQKRDELGWIV